MCTVRASEIRRKINDHKSDRSSKCRDSHKSNVKERCCALWGNGATRRTCGDGCVGVVEGWKFPNLRLNSGTAATCRSTEFRTNVQALHTTMSISTFFSSLVGTLHADAPQEEQIIEAPQEAPAVEEPAEEAPEDVRLPVPSSGALSLNQVWGVPDPPQVARRGAGVIKVQGYRPTLFPLPRKSSVREGLPP